MTWYEVQPGALDRDRRDFDVLDDDSVQRAEIADGALVIGHERFTAVLLPSCTFLQHATAAMLVRFVEAGGALIAVGALPERSTRGDVYAIAALRRLFESGRAIHIDSPNQIGATLATLPRPIDAPVPVLHRRVDGHDLVFVPAAFPRATELSNRHWLDIDYTLDLGRERARGACAQHAGAISGLGQPHPLHLPRPDDIRAVWAGDGAGRGRPNASVSMTDSARRAKDTP
jgi:hypothetical protein